MKKETAGRKCYDHLGGKLGATLLEFYLQNEWIQLKEGRTTVYQITPKGYEEFTKMGLNLEPDADLKL